MTSLRACVVLLACLPVALASLLTESGVMETLYTTTLNFRVGPQLPTGHVVALSAPLKTLSPKTVCTTGEDLAGAVLLFRDDSFQITREIVETSRCAQAKGAISLIVTTPDYYPGRLALADLSLSGSPHIVSIPVLQASNVRLSQLDKHMAVGNATIDVEITDNEWIDVFESGWFTICFRLFVPICAFVAAGYCVRCFSRQLAVRAKLDTQSFATESRWVSTNSLILATVGLECALATLLFVYCVFGPLFSNDIFPLRAHLMIFTLPALVSVASSLFAVALFLRWGSRATEHEGKERVAVATGIAMPALNTLIGSFYLMGSLTADEAVSTSLTLNALALILSFFVFVWVGCRFTRDIRSQGIGGRTSTMEERREALALRFEKWIMGVASAKLFAFGVLVVTLIFIRWVYWHPIGYCSSFLFTYLSTVAQSLVQGIGLCPHESSSKSVNSDLAKKATAPEVFSVPVEPIPIVP